MPVETPMPPTTPPDSPQTIARQLPPTRRAIEARQGGWTDFLQGIPVLARFKKSLRVGSATALAAIDGSDGAICASGAVAQLRFGDRTTPANYGGWYRDGGTIRLFSTEVGDIWTINPTTGVATLAASGAGAWTKVAGGVGFANSWVDFDATQTTRFQVAYMMDVCGFVNLRGAMKSGAINTTAFTLPAAFRPAKQMTLTIIDGVNTGQRVDITAAGAVVPLSGNTTFMPLDGLRFDTRT